MENVSSPERIVSSLAGAALLLPAVTRPSLGRIALGLAGAALLARGFSGYCQLYQALGISTAPEAPKRQIGRRDRVTEASEDSFPASDPPSWTPVRGSAAAT